MMASPNRIKDIPYSFDHMGFGISSESGPIATLLESLNFTQRQDISLVLLLQMSASLKR